MLTWQVFVQSVHRILWTKFFVFCLKKIRALYLTLFQVAASLHHVDFETKEINKWKYSNIQGIYSNALFINNNFHINFLSLKFKLVVFVAVPFSGCVRRSFGMAGLVIAYKVDKIPQFSKYYWVGNNKVGCPLDLIDNINVINSNQIQSQWICYYYQMFSYAYVLRTRTITSVVAHERCSLKRTH